MTKRSDSMKKIASMVKVRGHKNESLFNNIFGNPDADLSYTKEKPDCEITLQYHLKELSALAPTGNNVSLKSGNTWQIHLGEIPELTNSSFWHKSLERIAPAPGRKPITRGEHGISWDKQKEQLSSRVFWRKYLKKGDLLCYYDKRFTWTFFNMDQVIGFIVEFGVWRLIKASGRIKGDFFNLSGKLLEGIITYEYRSEAHKETFVLGAHGGVGNSANGLRLFKLLLGKIPSSSFSTKTGSYTHTHP